MSDSKNKWYKFRLFLILILALAALCPIVLKIFRVQITYSDYYRKKVSDQLTYTGTITAKRGIILDSDGEQLAVNVLRYRIFIAPDTIMKMMEEEREKETEEQSAEILRLDEFLSEKLAQITGISYEEIFALTKKSGRLDETIVSGADTETAEKIRALKSEYKLGTSVNIEEYSERYYLYGNLASNILGFMGVDGNGAYGIENYYNNVLSGTDGRYTVATDTANNIISEEYSSYIDAEDGNNLNLTINRKIQQILEEKIKKACDDSEAENGACGIVMNVKTGAILAMATYPDFDCNDPRTLTGFYADKLSILDHQPDSAQYTKLLGELQLQMWSNKPVSFSYIPGSTFKIITTGIALESATVKTTDKYTCTGWIRSVDGKTIIKCSNHYGHGELSFSEGLQQSCNPWFISAGLKIGTSLFYDYVENIGYFNKTGIDLPGESATVFWARNSFTQADLETCAFGQNFKVNPIRHLCCLASIANGGYVPTPHVVESITDNEGNTVWKFEQTSQNQIFSANVCEVVTDILAEGVAGNGGSRNAYVAGYRVAAKTGTSEKIGDADEDNKICSCVAFAPSDDPEIIMIILVDSPQKGTIYGSTIAAPYVSEAISEIMPYLGIDPVYTAKESAKLSVEIGDYVGQTILAAEKKIEKLGLTYETRGTGTTVTAQVPAAGENLHKDSGNVILYLGDSAPENNIKVPDLEGLTAVAARQTLKDAGLNININGVTNYETGTGAVVVSQSPAAGTKVGYGDIVTLTFRYLNAIDD